MHASPRRTPRAGDWRLCVDSMSPHLSATRRAPNAPVRQPLALSALQLAVERVAARINARALIIHDRDDPVVPWRQGQRVARAWSGARLHLTRGLGHGRILRDETVARTAADFIAGKSSVASVAAPAIPLPAPLY
jgi:pimeloyl-ACP methyl ester carboxylesterase